MLSLERRGNPLLRPRRQSRHLRSAPPVCSSKARLRSRTMPRWPCPHGHSNTHAPRRSRRPTCLCPSRLAIGSAAPQTDRARAPPCPGQAGRRLRRSFGESSPRALRKALRLWRPCAAPGMVPRPTRSDHHAETCSTSHGCRSRKHPCTPPAWQSRLARSDAATVGSADTGCRRAGPRPRLRWPARAEAAGPAPATSACPAAHRMLRLGLFVVCPSGGWPQRAVAESPALGPAPEGHGGRPPLAHPSSERR